MALLGDLVEIKGGGTPSRKVPEYWDGDIPWATVKDFKGLGLKTTQEKISLEGLIKSASNLIPSGSIIVPTRMALGKVAINMIDMAINQDLKALRIIDPEYVDRDYLFRALLNNSEYLEKRGKGATVKGITLDVLKELEIPLPPLAEQKRIAAILDKADAIRRKRQQAIDLTDQLLRSVFLDMFGDPVTNPKGWPIQEIESVCGKIVDCVNRTAPSVDYVTPYKMIRTTNIRNYQMNIQDVRYVEEEVYQKWIRRLVPERGDIIFTREAPAGEAAINRTDEKIFLGQRTMHFRPNFELATSEYLLHELMGAGIKRQIDRMKAGSTVTHLSVPECKKFKVRVPPIEMQKQFSERAKCLLGMRFKHLCSISLTEKAFASLTQRAFRGELTKQTKAA